MYRDDAFLLIDAILSLSIITLICAVLIPLLHQMNSTYAVSTKELEDYREFYVYVKSGGDVIEQGGALCRKDSETVCIQRR
ncbi:hypothetical protein [Macrococcus equipercicus]|uniref:Uncharacterized protein n=1 Tax=Macrococcus equipercicus TaxID=69967 RepID=A0A9Q9F0L9_9STAP|nr:hypothetical protein [Macrococcus equipercicus]UTH12940.1 hypothetical protein KFV11_06555 [Macrococcus equipercicus]